MVAYHMKAVLTTIEGPLSYLNFHKDVLQPYAKRMRRGFLEEKWQEREIQQIINELTSLFSYKDFCKFDAHSVPRPDNVTRYTSYLAQKYPEVRLLKPLDELIWKSGYECGGLESHVYYSVAGALRKWCEAGLKVATYADYSVTEQRLYFSYTNMGNLERYIDAHFDSNVEGSMHSAESYKRIAGKMNLNVASILYLTSEADEAEAAAKAGMPVVVVQRRGNALNLNEKQKGQFHVIEDFLALNIIRAGQ